MQFDFHSTRSILVQRGGSTQLAKIAREQGANKVLIVTDPGVLSAGLLEKALPQFKELGIPVHIFSDVQADPPVAVIEMAVQVAQEYQADCVIGFGGPSGSLSYSRVGFTPTTKSRPTSFLDGAGSPVVVGRFGKTNNMERVMRRAMKSKQVLRWNLDS